MLTETQIERYSRQLILPEIGGRGQERLLASRVLIVGDGDVARTAALYLAAAGVGRLGTAAAVVRTLNDLNPDCRTTVLAVGEASEVDTNALPSYDLVLDSAPPMDTAFTLSTACRTLGINVVLVRGCASGGWITTLTGPDAPCGACLAAQLETQTSPTDAVLPLTVATAQVLGSLAAMEAIKVVLGIGTSLVGRLLRYDATAATADETMLSRLPGCTGCPPNGTAHPTATR